MTNLQSAVHEMKGYLVCPKPNVSLYSNFKNKILLCGVENSCFLFVDRSTDAKGE